MDQLVSTQEPLDCSYTNAGILKKHLELLWDWHQEHPDEAHTALRIEKPRRTGGLEIVWEKDSDEQIILTGGVRRY